jgi:hypothetical protein
MKALVAKNFERIIWVGIILFIILFFKKCDGGNDKLDKLKAENKLLQAKYDRDSIAHAATRARWHDSIHNAAVNSDLQVKVIKEKEKELQASQSRINRLTEIVRTSNNNSNNSVLVSQEYKDACDSLPVEIDKQNQVIAALNENNEGLVDLMNYEIIYRDSLIEAETENRKHIGRLFNQQTIILQDALKAGKPRGRLLGGVGLIGNEINFLSGTKINLAYQSKGGKQYQVGGMIFKGGVYYEASVLITLIK